MRIIGIHGKARSGKDEVANILCESFSFEKHLFSQAVKEYAVKYFNLDPEIVFDKRTKESRAILQGIGSSVRNCTQLVKNSIDSVDKFGYPSYVGIIAETEFDLKPTKLNKAQKQIYDGILQLFSKENVEYFIDISKGVDEDIWISILNSKIKDSNNVIVIPDVRFINEKRFIENNNGKCIKVVRIDKPDIENNPNHISEINLDSETRWDYVLINEHKYDWRMSLLVSSVNMVRKFVKNNFFSEEDKQKFIVKL